MPTITTTVTSAQATGAVTTVTTTEATPEPAASADGVPHWEAGLYGGKMMTVQFWSFTDADQKALFMLNYHDIFAASCNRGNSGKSTFGYTFDTGALTLTSMWVWTDASFLLCEGIFAANKAIGSLIGKITLDSHWAGDISPAVAAKIAAWDQPAGFSCKLTPVAPNLRSIGSRIVDGIGIIMHQKFASKEAKAENDVAFLSMNAVFEGGFSTCIAFDVSDTERIHVWLAESKDATLEYFKNIAQPQSEAIMGVQIPKLLEFHGDYFGNTTDASIAKEMLAWPTFTARPLSSGSLGAAPVRFVQKIWFATKAARDALLIAMDKTPAHTALYAGFAVGETGVYITHMAKDLGECREFQATLGTNADFLEALSAAVAMPTYNFGNCGAEWMADVQGWAESYPALRWDDKAELVGNIWAQGKTNYDGKSFTAVQDTVLNSPEHLYKYVDACNSGELYEAFQEHGGNMAIWKTSAATVLIYMNFPSAQAWLDFEPAAAKLGEFWTECLKEHNVYMFGDVEGPKIKASLAAWNQAPWCNALTVKTAGNL